MEKKEQDDAHAAAAAEKMVNDRLELIAGNYGSDSEPDSEFEDDTDFLSGPATEDDELASKPVANTSPAAAAKARHSPEKSPPEPDPKNKWARSMAGVSQKKQQRIEKKTAAAATARNAANKDASPKAASPHRLSGSGAPNQPFEWSSMPGPSPKDLKQVTPAVRSKPQAPHHRRMHHRRRRQHHQPAAACCCRTPPSSCKWGRATA